jgi:Flp pilus assembly protein TadD
MDESGTGVDDLLAKADALIEVGRYRDAIELARSAVSGAPSDYRPLCVWSRSLMGERKFADSVEMATQATRLAPNVPFAFYVQSVALGSLATASRDRERIRIGREAVSAANECLRLAPYYSPGFIALGQAHALLGEIESADIALREAIRLAPSAVGTWVGASAIAIRAMNWEAAITASRRALAIEPGNYAALNNLGTALNASGDKRGVEVLASAARVDPDQITARRNMAMIGINKVRVVIMIVLIPVGLIAHAGFLLYVVFAVGSQIFISK